MMHIDDYFKNAVLLEVFNIALQQGFSIDNRQGLGMFIGPGLAAGAETGTKYHGAGNHDGKLIQFFASCTVCANSTFTLNLFRR